MAYTLQKHMSVCMCALRIFKVFQWLWYAAGWWLWLLEDRLPAEIVWDAAARTPDVELSINARFDHLLLPGNRNVARGKLIKNGLVGVVQSDSLHRGESPDIIQALGVHHFRVGDERRRHNTWRGEKQCKCLTQPSTRNKRGEQKTTRYLHSVSSSWCPWKMGELWSHHSIRS